MAGRGDDVPALTPADRWAAGLAAWAIPQEIVDQAAGSPWELPVERFARRADDSVARPGGWSFERAGSMLPFGGSVLDLGVGAGAASLPLAPRASAVTGVDANPQMLSAFLERGGRTRAVCRAVEGSWPEVAPRVAPHDVVVAHHVVYNVAELVPFLAAATAAARRGVVVELPPRHPLSWMNDLWERFWGLSRPSTPTADDFVAVVRELGVRDLVVYRWTRDDPDTTPLDERAALVTRRLCLGADRIDEVRQALVDRAPQRSRDVVTVAWSGDADRRAP